MSSRRAEQRRRVFCDKSNAMKKDCSTTDHRTPSVSSTSLQGANDKRQPPVASARSRSVTGRGTFAIQFRTRRSSVIFVLTYFLVLVLVLVFEIFFSFSFVLVFIIFSF